MPLHNPRVRRNPQLLHARLTGQLNRRTIEQMRAAVAELASSSPVVIARTLNAPAISG